MMYVGICISLVLSTTNTQSIRTIEAMTIGGIYDDNIYTAISKPNSKTPAWTITNGPGSDSSQLNGNITYEPNTNTSFLGPFSGSGIATTDDIWTISQSFICSKDSSVSVEYTLHWCGDSSSTDWTELTLGGIIQPLTRIDGSHQEFDGILNLDHTDQLTNISSCTTWQYKSIPYSTNIIDTTAGASFDVSFEIALSSNEEFVSISNVDF